MVAPSLPAVQTIQTTDLYWSSAPSPRGTCVVMATGHGVCWAGTPGTSQEVGLAWTSRRMKIGRVIEEEAVAPLQQAMHELRRYLAGEPLQFACPLDLHGTPFQVAVWNALYRIPYGEVRSYTEVARAIGHPTAVRAVGAANGANPVAIIVPCHRVIGSNGALTGYGGGLPTKAWLLALEGIDNKSTVVAGLGQKRLRQPAHDHGDNAEFHQEHDDPDPRLRPVHLIGGGKGIKRM